MERIKSRISRRNALKTLLSGVAVLGTTVSAFGAKKMIKPWQWINHKDKMANVDGTPLQFMPKSPKDPNPTVDELKKYPRCPYCGMMRKMWSHSRYLIHYDNDQADGTCSIHCAALSLSLNLDLKPKAIYVGNAGAKGKVKPLILVDDATYLVGSKNPGTMTAESKWAYGSNEAAEAAIQKTGGRKVGFDEALTASYVSMAKDTLMIRKKRAKKRSMEQT